MQWKDRVCVFWFPWGRAKVALGGAEDGSRREKCNSQDQRMAAGRILNRSGESKMAILVE